MLRDSIPLQPVSDAQFSDLKLNQTIIKILDILGQWLPIFSAEFRQSSTNIKKENEISVEICSFLNDTLRHADQRGYPFNFSFHDTGVDFLIKLSPYKIGTKPLFTIEAKRLPPTNHKDYVQSKKGAGGIARFKRQQKGFDIEQNECAMFAYVQSHNFKHWHAQVNNWIGELITNNSTIQGIDWLQQDKLTHLSTIRDIAKYQSIHSRKTKEQLTIHHFWIDLTV